MYTAPLRLTSPVVARENTVGSILPVDASIKQGVSLSIMVSRLIMTVLPTGRFPRQAQINPCLVFCQFIISFEVSSFDNVIEIPKTRMLNEDINNAKLLDLMKFLDAKTEDELTMLAEKSPATKKATLRLMELSADEKARQLYEARLKERRDNYAREQGAVKHAKFEIVKNALKKNISIDDISDITGLTHSEIEAVRNAV